VRITIIQFTIPFNHIIVITMLEFVHVQLEDSGRNQYLVVGVYHKRELVFSVVHPALRLNFTTDLSESVLSNSNFRTLGG
jgi:hypothetical protein